ncbi:MAG TPA: hypothetical protein VGH32_01665 [Pirellulales bacterium]
MVRAVFGWAIVGLLFAPTWCRGEAPPAISHDESPSLNGLWFGAWGGGPQPGGVVFQPVIAELFVKGKHVELSGFPNGLNLEGTIRIDSDAKYVRITPAAEPGKTAAPKPVEFPFTVDGDKLTMTVADKRSVTLQRLKTSQNPLANVAVELISADEITESGDLIVSEFQKLRVGSIGATYFEPSTRRLKTARAAVLLVEESDCKQIKIGEARSRLKRSTPVAIAYRPDNRPNPNALHQLWSAVGPAAADDAAARQTLAKTLRPGTLVFILSASENVPIP